MPECHYYGYASVCNYDDLYFAQLAQKASWQDHVSAGFRELGKGLPSSDPIGDYISDALKAGV